MTRTRIITAATAAVALLVIFVGLLYWNPVHAWRVRQFRRIVDRAVTLAAIGTPRARLEADLKALRSPIATITQTKRGEAVAFELVFHESWVDDPRLLFGYFRGHTFLPPYSYEIRLIFDANGRVSASEVVPTYD